MGRVHAHRRQHILPPFSIPDSDRFASEHGCSCWYVNPFSYLHPSSIPILCAGKNASIYSRLRETVSTGSPVKNQRPAIVLGPMQRVVVGTR